MPEALSLFHGYEVLHRSSDPIARHDIGIAAVISLKTPERMSYIENGIAMFNNSARRTFIEYAQSYREKDANYLHGTTLLKNRVLNGLVEMMMSELKTEMNRVLQEHRMMAPEEYSTLKLRLSLYYDDYVSRFRNLEFDIDNHHPNL